MEQMMEVYNNLKIKLKSEQNFLPYMLVNMATEIFNVKDDISSDDLKELVQIFHDLLSRTGNQDILDYHIDYIIRIIDGGEVLYEEIHKIYSLCEECYILKEIGCMLGRNTSILYTALKQAKQ